MSDVSAVRRIVFVTGPAGAGRTSALRVLEDLGFEAIDNMPLRFLQQLVETPPVDRGLALGIDPRTREFSTDAVTESLGYLGTLPDVVPELLYMDCSVEALLQRFSETRRRHPSAVSNMVEAGILREIESLAPLHDRADFHIDTSGMNVHEMRAQVEAIFAPGGKGVLSLAVHSFSYKRGLPRGVDVIFDCRFLRNPYWQPQLRKLDGRSPQVRSFVEGDPRYADFQRHVLDFLFFLLPAQIEEGKSHFSVGFGCTGGQHRSVTLARNISVALADSGWQVSTRHRELSEASPKGRR